MPVRTEDIFILTGPQKQEGTGLRATQGSTRVGREAEGGGITDQTFVVSLGGNGEAGETGCGT